MNGQWIDHGHGFITWRMPKNAEDIETLEVRGVKNVASLISMFCEEFDHEIFDEHMLCMAKGLSFKSIPCWPIFPPGREEIDECLKTLVGDGPTLFHCRESCDRTGRYVLHYLIKMRGFSFDSAVEYIKARGFHKRYWWWIPILRRMY